MVDSRGQEIGDLLGVTRQAAFRRFGKDKTVHMARAAERVCAATVWPVTGLVGAFGGFGETEPCVRRIGDHKAVGIPLRYEVGNMVARAAF
ncbi:hypothetical protein HEP84_13020 [Streptomyces sp. RLB1-33]|uniref:hypothetical protein n=1 Tax=Streptomyces mirabilis TaxID=68239 RepID=UPI00143E9982|nr:MULTISPECIES: hypothetical protein [Streptomyces]QIY69944.1 hypothetical protein HEP84_13020 [Streptomyces sp. RLB1-33]QUW83181.1 hypothetical protein SMIR_31890 [Streptomyces mirabilis]